MREWFIVGSKLLGVYFLYWALISLLGEIGLALSILSSNDSPFPGLSSTVILLTSAFSSIVMIAFAFALLFKTELIADKLKLTGFLKEFQGIRHSDSLHSGITLIGIYIFCTKIGSLAKVILASLKANSGINPFAATQPKGLTFSLDFAEPGFTLLFSLLLIIGSKRIAEFLEKGKQA